MPKVLPAVRHSTQSEDRIRQAYVESSLRRCSADDFFDRKGKNEDSLVASICTGLGEMQQQLKEEMADLMKAEMCCESALKMLQKEEMALKNKLGAIRTRLKTTSSMRKEADMMLKLHETLGKSGSLSGTVRAVQDMLTEDMPVDMRVMVGDCINSRHTGNVRECIVCTSSFTAEDLLVAAKTDRCRHTLYPCGHSVVCGSCAKKIWESSGRCPLCRAHMTKKPKIFRPGRQQ